MKTYNGQLKRLGLEEKVLVRISLKIARRVKMLAKDLKDREKS